VNLALIVDWCCGGGRQRFCNAPFVTRSSQIDKTKLHCKQEGSTPSEKPNPAFQNMAKCPPRRHSSLLFFVSSELGHAEQAREVLGLNGR
jgi:hypothetical protein